MYIAVTLKSIIILIYVAFLWKCDDDMLAHGNDDGFHIFNVGLRPMSGDIPMLNRKIFRGMRVTIQEHPYVVSVRRKCAHYSTAVLVSQSLAISVAHPLTTVPIYELGIVMGETYADRGTILLTVVLIVVHDAFDPYTLNADLAMIRTYESVKFKTSIKPVGGLFKWRTLFANKKAFITGWGRCDVTGKELCLPRSSRYYPDEKIDPILKTVSYQITSAVSNRCDMYGRKYNLSINPRMLCLGPARRDNPAAPCMAVPGAPLVVDGKLLGLQSWGFACGYRYDLPVIYTDIRKYYNWISYNVDLMHSIDGSHLSGIFQATKAFILSDWLNNTRVIKQKNHDFVEEEIQPLDVDRTLGHLKGTVYDIRNFISVGKHNEGKIKMYELIRVMINRINKLDKIGNALTDMETEPFIKYGLDDDDASRDAGEGGYLSYVDATNDSVYSYGSGEDSE